LKDALSFVAENVKAKKKVRSAELNTGQVVVNVVAMGVNPKVENQKVMEIKARDLDLDPELKARELENLASLAPELKDPEPELKEKRLIKEEKMASKNGQRK